MTSIAQPTTTTTMTMAQKSRIAIYFAQKTLFLNPLATFGEIYPTFSGNPDPFPGKR